jgi:hypothetical protein
MADPLRLAAALAEIGIARYAQSEWKRSGATLLLKVVIVTCAGLAGGFGVAALVIYLIPVVGAAEATLIVGGLLLVTSAVVAGIARAMVRLGRGPPALVQGRDLEALVVDAEGFVRQNKGLVLAAAFVAGLLTAEKTRDADR